MASRKIAEFATDDRPWLVAVRMVSEGVDIPRLRVGVYATTTSTELFFRQAVGRFVRWQVGRATQKAYVYVPDDPRLRQSRLPDRRGPSARPASAGRSATTSSRPTATSTGRCTTTICSPSSSRCSPSCRRPRPVSSSTPSPSQGVPPLRRRARSSRSDLRRRPEPRGRPARDPDRGRSRPVGIAQRRREEGRPAYPQRRRRQATRRSHRLGPRQGAGRDEPARRHLEGVDRNDRPARTPTPLRRELAPPTQASLSVRWWMRPPTQPPSLVARAAFSTRRACWTFTAVATYAGTSSHPGRPRVRRPE